MQASNGSVTGSAKADRTVRRLRPRTGVGRFAVWLGLASGVALGIGYFITLPLWFFPILLLLIVGCAAVLAVDQIPHERERSRMSTTWRRIRRFFGWLFYMLP